MKMFACLVAVLVLDAALAAPQIPQLQAQCSNLPTGNYQVPGSCSSYLSCNNGIGFQGKCPSNLVFDYLINKCVFQINLSIQQQIECGLVDSMTQKINKISKAPQLLCVGLPNGNFQYPGDCSSYLTCSNGIGYKMSCPAGLVFDQQINQCNYASNLNPRRREICGLSNNRGSSALCIGLPNGNYPYPGDCTSYLMCSNNNAMTMSCPGGLEYDTNTEKCTNPSNLSPKRRLTCRISVVNNAETTTLPSVSDLTRSDSTTQDSFRTTTLTAPSLLDLFLAFVANRRSPLHGRGSSHDMDPISDETKIRSQDKDESHHKGPSGKIDFEELLKEFAGINSNKLPCKCPSVPEVPKKSEMDIIKEIIKEAGSEEAESKKKFNFRDSSDKDEGLGGLVIGGNSGSKGHDNKGGNHKNSEISDILEVISKENGKSNNGKSSENHGKSSESHGKSSKNKETSNIKKNL